MHTSESTQPSKKVPVHLMRGFLGVGKTTAINHLIKNKPEGERWALVVNEFGQIGVDASLLEAGEDLQIKELPGGCICCALGLTLSVTLINLLQRFKPDRLIIEPTGLGHPAGIIDLLTGGQFNDVLELRPLVTLVDPRLLDEPKVVAHETFQDQIALADILVFNKTDLASEAQTKKALGEAQQMFPPKLALLTCEKGELPLSVLDSAAQLISQQTKPKTTPSHHPKANFLAPQTAGLAFLALPEVGKPVCQQGEGLGAFSVGWVFHRDDAFDEDKLYQWIDQQQNLLRIKGVFRVGTKQWRSFNKVGSEMLMQAITYRRDSRLELLADEPFIKDSPLDVASLQEQLLALTFKPKEATLFDA